MPVVFGPSTGPRQGPNGERYDYRGARRTVAAVSYLTDHALLARFLPPHCVLDGDPVVTVEHVHLHQLEWLAGRDYSLLQVKYPVLYSGSEQARGPFLPVLWENRVEPILTGREELGFAKLYCELPRPELHEGVSRWSARWDGHEFCRLTLGDLHDAPSPAPNPAVDGVIHQRYMPGLSDGRADIDEMVISPASATIDYASFQRGIGSIEFIPSTWQQLPTMFHIVNALANLPVIEIRGASLAHTIGASALSDQRRLE